MAGSTTLEGSNDETLEAVEGTHVMQKQDMHVFTSRMTQDELASLISDYGILKDLHPRLPPPSFVMSDLNPHKMIGLYHHFFHLFGVRVPFSKFLLNVIKFFKVHISQIVPLGLNRVVNFEIFCRALHITPRVVLFRVFYTLCKQGDWFSFSRRRGAPQCFYEHWTGLKEWKEHFFLIDRRAIPMAMPWRHRLSCVKFPVPCKEDYYDKDVKRLSKSPMILRRPPQEFLVVLGLSNVWDDDYFKPVIEDAAGNVLSMARFLRLASLEGVKINREPMYDGDTTDQPTFTHVAGDCTRAPAAPDDVLPRLTSEQVKATMPDPKSRSKGKDIS
ncbi:hypothetical protein Tco_1564537, partial [Tanacetum coccineum]